VVRHPSARTVAAFLLAFTLAGCGASAPEPRGDAVFRSRDRALLSSLQESRAGFEEGRLSLREYEQLLSAAEADERVLFDDVRRHTFTNASERDYWYRSRLKFPSPVSAARKALGTAPSTRTADSP
jgi:hypothetical protein